MQHAGGRVLGREQTLLEKQLSVRGRWQWAAEATEVKHVGAGAQLGGICSLPLIPMQMFTLETARWLCDFSWQAYYIPPLAEFLMEGNVEHQTTGNKYGRANNTASRNFDGRSMLVWS